MTELRFTLPWGISCNGYWAGARYGRRYVSARAREYQAEVDEILTANGIPREKLSGSLSIELVTHAPSRAVYDLDNRLKGILDCLKLLDVIEDDRHIDGIVIRRGAIVRGGCVEVVLRQHPDRAEQQAIA